MKNNTVIAFFNIPICITLTRIALTPLMSMCMFNNYWKSALCLFCIAMATDFLDGFLARLWHQTTVFGAFLDPIADKILILTSFVVLHKLQPQYVPWWFIVFIGIRECITVIGCVTLFLTQKIKTVTPSPLGKAAAAITMIYIMLICCIVTTTQQTNSALEFLIHSWFVIVISLTSIALGQYCYYYPLF